MNHTQTYFEFEAHMPAACLHPDRMSTMAVVPAGVCCCYCGALICQAIPRPPEVLGYVSADWAWHHRDGKAWTTR